MNVEKSKILVIGRTEVNMDAPVDQRVDIDGLVVVRVYPTDEELNSYPRCELNRNVYAYDSTGRLVWQIQEAPQGGAFEDKAYMDIRVENRTLVAGNWIGIDYQVDLEAGAVLPLAQGSRPW